MSTTTAAVPVSAKKAGYALRSVAVGLSVLAVIAMAFMLSGYRPEGALLDISEATSSLLPLVALIVNIVSVVKHNRKALDIASLIAVAIVVGAMIVDAAIYTFGG